MRCCSVLLFQPSCYLPTEMILGFFCLTNFPSSPPAPNRVYFGVFLLFSYPPPPSSDGGWDSSKAGSGLFFVFLSSGFCLGCTCLLLLVFLCFVCLEIQIVRFVISTFTPIEISFVYPPPLPIEIEISALILTPQVSCSKGRTKDAQWKTAEGIYFPARKAWVKRLSWCISAFLQMWADIVCRFINDKGIIWLNQNYEDKVVLTIRAKANCVTHIHDMNNLSYVREYTRHFQKENVGGKG